MKKILGVSGTLKLEILEWFERQRNNKINWKKSNFAVINFYPNPKSYI